MTGGAPDVRGTAAGRADHPARPGRAAAVATRSQATLALTWSRPRTSTSRPGERAVVGTGIAIALPAGYAAFVHPRSGLAARHGVTLVNAPGTIDAGYRGEIKVILLNTDPATAGLAPPR